VAESGVEAQSDLVEIVLALAGQVRSLGQELAKQAVSVFVAAALPGAARVGKVEHHPGTKGQRRVMLALT